MRETASRKGKFSVAIIFLTSLWNDHSWQFRSVERWGSLQKMQTGSVALIEGQVVNEWSFKPQWLHLDLLRQNLAVWPNRKQLLHCMGERTLGEILKMTL